MALLSAQLLRCLRSLLDESAASQRKANCFTGQPAICLDYGGITAAKTVNLPNVDGCCRW
jgi:hypothetical protein